MARAAKAACVAIGTELLRFEHRDTNSAWLLDRLDGMGIEGALWFQVDDDVERIAAAVDTAADCCDLVLLTGGLGPTEDDRTREAMAKVLGSDLERDADLERRLREAFARRGYRFAENNARQADLPRGASWLPNPLGSAWGIGFEHRGALVAAMPGVPGEMRRMFEDHVEPQLEPIRRAHLASRSFKVAGWGESSLDAELEELHRDERSEITVLSGREGIVLRVRARGTVAEEAQDRLEAIAAAIEGRFGEDIYARAGESLAEVVGAKLLETGRRLATAESCTGGMLGATLTDVPGSSGWYRGGWVVYDDRLKTELAGVAPELLAQEGAVSEPVARQLAEAVRRSCDTDFGIGITGIAGPAGGTSEKPVGLVHVALAEPETTWHWRLRLSGDRWLVRAHTVRFALDRLRRVLDGLDAARPRR